MLLRGIVVNITVLPALAFQGFMKFQTKVTKKSIVYKLQHMYFASKHGLQGLCTFSGEAAFQKLSKRRHHTFKASINCLLIGTTPFVLESSEKKALLSSPTPNSQEVKISWG